MSTTTPRAAASHPSAPPITRMAWKISVRLRWFRASTGIPGLDQLAHHVRLQVGEREDEIGSELDDPIERETS